MTLEEAQRIYSQPKGKSKEELIECIRVLNEADQPVQVNWMQMEAIIDANRRLSGTYPRLLGRQRK